MELTFQLRRVIQDQSESEMPPTRLLTFIIYRPERRLIYLNVRQELMLIFIVLRTHSPPVEICCARKTAAINKLG